jgi:hypothetical protein
MKMIDEKIRQIMEAGSEILYYGPPVGRFSPKNFKELAGRIADKTYYSGYNHVRYYIEKENVLLDCAFSKSKDFRNSYIRIAGPDTEKIKNMLLKI